MHLPYLQVVMELVEQTAPDLAVLLEWDEACAGWGLVQLWKWALGRCPEDAPPSACDVVTGPAAARLIARAARYPDAAEAFAQACIDVRPAVLVPASDGIRIKGLDRYDAAWGKSHDEAWKLWKRWVAERGGKEAVAAMPQDERLAAWRAYSRRVERCGASGVSPPEKTPPGPEPARNRPGTDPSDADADADAVPAASQRGGRARSRAAPPPPADVKPPPPAAPDAAASPPPQAAGDGAPAAAKPPAPAEPPAPIAVEPSPEPRAELRAELERVYQAHTGQAYRWTRRDLAALARLPCAKPAVDVPLLGWLFARGLQAAAAGDWPGVTSAQQLEQRYVDLVAVAGQPPPSGERGEHGRGPAPPGQAPHCDRCGATEGYGLEQETAGRHLCPACSALWREAVPSGPWEQVVAATNAWLASSADQEAA